MVNFLCLQRPASNRSKNRHRSGNRHRIDDEVHGELSSVSEVHNKSSVVRIVLASGLVEVYDTAVTARHVIKKYPGLCLARPEVFKMPHKSLVGPKEILSPGQKFYLVPATTVEKLKRKCMVMTSEISEGVDVKAKDKREGEETVCSAIDVYALRDEWSECSLQRLEKQEEKKCFDPPIKKATRMRKGVLDGWKPTLPSVEEISP